MSAGISAAGWVAIGGATAGALSSAKGAKGGGGTTQNKMDPRMDPYVFGSEDGQTDGIAQIANDLFNANRSGLNDQMRQGLNSQWATYNDPFNMAGYRQMAQLGSGLMTAPMMGNPFADGRASLYSGGATSTAPNLGMGPVGGAGQAVPAKPAARPSWSPDVSQVNFGAPGPFTAPPPPPPAPPPPAPAPPSQRMYNGLTWDEAFNPNQYPQTAQDYGLPLVWNGMMWASQSNGS